MDISIFINERSLHGQYADVKQFSDAFNQILQVLTAIEDAKQQKTVFKSVLLEWNYDAMQDQNFANSISQIRHLGRVEFFRDLMHKKLKVKDWQDTQIHSNNDKFTVKEIDVTGETLAEAAERQLQQHNCLILNFLQSDFDVKIEVCKNKRQKTVLDAIANRVEWADFLQQKRLVRTLNKNNKHGENGTGAHKNNKKFAVSLLYCSVAEAQNWLDSAIKSNTHAERLYNFDTKKQKFIVFYYEGDTPQNQYHAFHLEDENDAPKDIQTIFKK